RRRPVLRSLRISHRRHPPRRQVLSALFPDFLHPPRLSHPAAIFPGDWPLAASAPARAIFRRPRRPHHPTSASLVVLRHIHTEFLDGLPRRFRIPRHGYHLVARHRRTVLPLDSAAHP